MPIAGCFCYGENTPTLEHYCACQDKGDREDHERRCAAAKPYEDLANDAYYGGDEMAAYDHVYEAENAAMAVRRGDWVQLASGRPFWPLDPRPEDIHISDIAHALSMTCRFGGHCLRYYSVAEHSVLMARAMKDPQHKMWALLHDSAEGLGLVDLLRPVKKYMPEYREAEAKVMAAVCKRFGLPLEIPPEVKAADDAILMDEKHQNMAKPAIPWDFSAAPLGVKLHYWRPEQACREFLLAFEALTAEANT